MGSEPAGPAGVLRRAARRWTAATLLVAMLREEWRWHADLFGGRRFAAFPFFVALLAGGGVYGLGLVGIGLSGTIAGLHALVLLFGLQTGTVGFVGRDAMRNLLGDITLLVFSTRTLPLGRRTTLGVFLLKDLLYYAVLFMIPLSAAFVPPALSGELAPAAVGLLWVTLTGTFTLGIAGTLALVALSTRGLAGRLATLGAAVGIGLAWALGADVVAATPYALYADPSPGAAALPAAVVVGLAALGLWVYDPEHERAARSAGAAFARWRRRLGDSDGVTTRSLLEVHRSSGGFGKVGLSAALLFLVSAFLVELVAPVVGADPSAGITFGALLGLSAFTTYNWLTQFDDPGEYRRLPLDLRAVFAAKLRAFLLVSVPVGLVSLAAAVLWLGGRPRETVVGIALLVGFQVYVFGLVVYLAGFSPTEFLFDTVLFAAFGAAIAVPLVPVLVVGLAVTPVPGRVLAGLALLSVLLAAVGVATYRRAAPKWERAYRSGEV